MSGHGDLQMRCCGVGSAGWYFVVLTRCWRGRLTIIAMIGSSGAVLSGTEAALETQAAAASSFHKQVSMHVHGLAPRILLMPRDVESDCESGSLLCRGRRVGWEQIAHAEVESWQMRML